MPCQLGGQLEWELGLSEWPQFGPITETNKRHSILGLANQSLYLNTIGVECLTIIFNVDAARVANKKHIT